jgi:peptide/nickel transport system ATP-binding protein
VHGRRPDRLLQEEIARLLTQVALDPALASRRPNELSGGERQRVNVARALAIRPRVLVCDEITSALDPDVGDQLLALLDGLRSDGGPAVLLISHDLDALRAHAHEIAVLDHGRRLSSPPVTPTSAPPLPSANRSA